MNKYQLAVIVTISVNKSEPVRKRVQRNQKWIWHPFVRSRNDTDVTFLLSTTVTALKEKEKKQLPTQKKGNHSSRCSYGENTYTDHRDKCCLPVLMLTHILEIAMLVIEISHFWLAICLAVAFILKLVLKFHIKQHGLNVNANVALLRIINTYMWNQIHIHWLVHFPGTLNN